LTFWVRCSFCMYLWSYTLIGSKNRLSWFNHSKLAVFVFNISEDIVWKLSNTKQEQRIWDALFLLSITWPRTCAVRAFRQCLYNTRFSLFWVVIITLTKITILINRVCSSQRKMKFEQQLRAYWFQVCQFFKGFIKDLFVTSSDLLVSRLPYFALQLQ